MADYTLGLGATRRFKANEAFQGAPVSPAQPVTWSTDSPGILTLAPVAGSPNECDVTAVKQGTGALLTATVTGASVSGHVSLDVVFPVDSVTVVGE